MTLPTRPAAPTTAVAPFAMIDAEFVSIIDVPFKSPYTGAASVASTPILSPCSCANQYSSPNTNATMSSVTPMATNVTHFVYVGSSL